MADVYGMRIAVPPMLDEATSMGAAVIGGVGVGVLEGFGAIGRFIGEMSTVEPDLEIHRYYRRVQGIFRKSYQYLASTFGDIADQAKLHV
jgi:xylulokinase